MIKFLNKSTQMMSAAVMTGVFVSLSNEAKASTQDLLSMTQQVGNQSEGLPQLINGVFYICGSGLVGLGLFGVKNHVDTPSQNKLPPAIAKCGIGGTLLATPYLGDNFLQSVTGGTAGSGAEVMTQTTTIF